MKGGLDSGVPTQIAGSLKLKVQQSKVYIASYITTCIQQCNNQKVRNIPTGPLSRVCKPKNRYFKSSPKLLSCVGVGLIKKTLEWQQISSIPSISSNSYVKIERFLFAVFWNLIQLCQYSHPSIVRSSTPTRKYR